MVLWWLLVLHYSISIWLSIWFKKLEVSVTTWKSTSPQHHWPTTKFIHFTCCKLVFLKRHSAIIVRKRNESTVAHSVICQFWCSWLKSNLAVQWHTVKIMPLASLLALIHSSRCLLLGRLRGLAVVCWTTDHYHPCSNPGVGISEGCFVFHFVSLPLEVTRPINLMHKSGRKTSIIIIIIQMSVPDCRGC